jgi:hypothetical protein
MASKYTKKCSTFLVVKEVQIKTTLRFQLTPVRMTITKSNNNKNAGKDVVIQEPLYTDNEKASYYNH